LEEGFSRTVFAVVTEMGIEYLGHNNLSLNLIGVDQLLQGLTNLSFVAIGCGTVYQTIPRPNGCLDSIANATTPLGACQVPTSIRGIE
jgi:hypothetical protein